MLLSNQGKIGTVKMPPVIHQLSASRTFEQFLSELKNVIFGM
jgi:hypothetical protein